MLLFHLAYVPVLAGLFFMVKPTSIGETLALTGLLAVFMALNMMRAYYVLKPLFRTENL